MQMDIFSLMRERFVISKPIRLISLFAGYGSQALWFKYLGVKYEDYKICEWAVKSIQAYKDIHFTNDNTDYSASLTHTQLIQYLTDKGISADYNKPMTYEQIKRLGEDKARTIYNNIVATHNLVNIQQAKGKDLEIVDNDKYCYVMTYSFPCQDLSMAGNMAGMKDTSTRSGLLWEVERILMELKETNSLPSCLILENVPQVHGAGNVEDFNKWQLRLEELGYCSYWEDLTGTDYGIPQSRNRTFLISLLGEYSYNFPKNTLLKYKLKDLLEKQVDEKYYLSKSMIDYISADNEKWTGNNNSAIVNKDIASTLNTNEGSRRCDASNYISNDLEDNADLKKIIIVGKTKSGGERSAILSTQGSCSTLTATDYKQPKQIVDTDYIGTYNFAKSEAFAHGKRFVPNNDISETLLATGNQAGVVVKENLKAQMERQLIDNGLVEENDVVRHNYTNSKMDKESKGANNISPTLDTRCDCLGVVVKDSYTDIEKALFTEDGNIRRYINSDIIDEFKEGQMATTTYPNGYGHGSRTHNESIALNTIDRPSVKYNLRIRKLTPRECFRLMGVKEEDFSNCARNQSNASLYHLAGDSIITTVGMGIVGELLGIDYTSKINELLEELKEK